jgi:hypothetical protein
VAQAVCKLRGRKQQPRNIGIYAYENCVVPITESRILNEATLRAIVKCLMEFSHSLGTKRPYLDRLLDRFRRIAVVSSSAQLSQIQQVVTSAFTTFATIQRHFLDIKNPPKRVSGRCSKCPFPLRATFKGKVIAALYGSSAIQHA